MRTDFLCISVLRVASWPRVMLASCKSVLNPPVVYTIDCSKAVVPLLVLLFVALWFVLCLTFCYFVLLFFIFSPFSITITSLGEQRANFSVFSYVCSICDCLVLSVSSSSWCLEGQRFVIVAYPGRLPLFVVFVTYNRRFRVFGICLGIKMKFWDMQQL